MEINEAIKHCREKAVGCSECAKDHGQLAEWLEELQNYRDTGLTPSMVRSLIKREKESNKRAVERAIQLDELRERIRWIPVSERMPEKPTKNPEFDNKPLELYLVSVKNTKYPFRAFWNGENFTDGWCKVNATAWMPLPEPYKAE